MPGHAFLIRTMLSLALLAPVAAAAQQASDTIAPEAATGMQARPAAHATRHMVAAANPLAAEAGLEVLRKGGSAADALVAVQTVLGLVEPQSSGMGGGAFLVWYDAATGEMTTIDGRETAPAAATPDLFLDADGEPLGFFEAVVGGRSVGVPGVPRLLETAHRRWGRLDWAALFDPAIKLASEGFEVSPRLAALVAADADKLGAQPTTAGYFFPGGKPLAAGDRLSNPTYAETLRAIAEGGADAFHAGPIAEAIVVAVTGHETNPGAMTLDDLAGYEAKERPAACIDYRGHEVCGMGPPSSGAITVGQILGMVEGFDLSTLGPDDPESWRIFGEATRLAFADRGRYLADPDFVRVPEGMLDRGYLESRAALIRRPTAMGPDEVKAGEPPWEKAELRIDGTSLEQPATSHMVIVDDAGNVASMTSSVENAFGARLMAAGMLLNNQLTDFSFAPKQDGDAIANRVEPGKRPRSSMSPTIILQDGKPVHALGSPGGATIIPYVAKTIVALIDWRMDMQRAISLPHLANPFGRYMLEAGTSADDLADDLAAFGYEVRAGELNSGLHGVTIGPGGLTGGADPRREGVALGD
ncbi:MAG: gamma-glutamyltransferase [Rhizobiaceae bacterium]|nr:gamma-glutamyltransferase [Rhizobiaceae bacterium]MCV0408654.1 gamma-glutamyltransferase [Rhizobiaceae bacterium]